MTKEDIKRELESGRSFLSVFPFQKEGQKCTIFKAPWPDTEALTDHMDDVVYVPDTSLNEISGIVDKTDLNEDGINEILRNCCTIRDFLREGYGNEKLAHDIYAQCNWQHPNIMDIMDCTDNDEAVRKYGQSWDDMQAFDRLIKKTRKELYRLYQLDWMMAHGYSLADIVKICAEYADDVSTEKNDTDCGSGLDYYSFKNHILEQGINGELFVCYDEFLHAEYLDEEYAGDLIGRLSSDHVGYHRLWEIDTAISRTGYPIEKYYSVL